MQISIYKCAWCGEFLMSPKEGRQPRSDKRFCSKKCTARYSRWYKRIKVHEKRAIAAVQALSEYLEHPMAAPTAAASMRAVVDAVKIEAAAHGARGVN